MKDKEKLKVLKKVSDLTRRHCLAGELRIPPEVAKLDDDAFYTAVDLALRSHHPHQSIFFHKKWRDGSKANEELRRPPKMTWHSVPRVGYIKFYTYVFTEGVDVSVDRPWDPRPESTVTACRWQIEEWIRKGMRGLVIDLSEHQGGSFRPAMHALGEHLLKDRKVYEMIDSTNKHTPVFYDGEKEIFGNKKRSSSCSLSAIFRVAVVVSSKTYSSGEIVAAILHGREGTRTFGKTPTGGGLSANDGYNLAPDVSMLLCVRRYITCDGVIHTDEKIQPHEITPSPLKDAIRWAQGEGCQGGSPTSRVTVSLSQNHLRSTFRRLGFRGDVLNRVFPMREREAQNYTSSHLRNSIPLLWRKWRTLSDPKASIERSLFNAGFKANIAKRLSLVVGPLESSDLCPYTRDQIVDIAISYALGWDHRPMRGRRIAFPKNANLSEQWFQVSEDDEEVRNGSMWHANVDSESAMEVVKSMPGLQGEEILYFHATSWRSACGIAGKKRPSNKMGLDCLDFGIQQSFYTTPSLETALDWIEAHWEVWRGESAMIVFSLPKKFPDTLSFRAFERADEDWVRLTKHSRMCQGDSNELDDLDLVSGPMVANPSAVEARNAKPRAHNPPKYQLASKSDDGDKFMGARMKAILWVNKLQ